MHLVIQIRMVWTEAVLSRYHKSMASRQEKTETKSTSISSQNPLVEKQAKKLKILEIKGYKTRKTFI